MMDQMTDLASSTRTNADELRFSGSAPPANPAISFATRDMCGPDRRSTRASPAYACPAAMSSAESYVKGLSADWYASSSPSPPPPFFPLPLPFPLPRVETPPSPPPPPPEAPDANPSACAAAETDSAASRIKRASATSDAIASRCFARLLSSFSATLSKDDATGDLTPPGLAMTGDLSPWRAVFGPDSSLDPRVPRDSLEGEGSDAVAVASAATSHSSTDLR